MIGLYAWGANSHGQLGLGYTCEMVCEPQRVDELPAQLCESKVASIVGGGGHTIIVSTAGTLYGAGWNNAGQVGDGTASRCVPHFRQCRGLEGQVITDVSCGWAHTVACSSTGHVWVWGSNSHGQLGLPCDEVPFSSLPICLELTGVTSVAAGLRHTVVVTSSGEVYTWGHGQRGQLGHLVSDGYAMKTLPSPKLMETLEAKVVSVACGQNMTYAITEEGALLAWGDNKWGQLAHDPRNLLFFTCPLTIPSNYFGCERVMWARAGWTHCVVGTSSGAVYTWGRADYCQLGPPADDTDDFAMLGVTHTNRQESKTDTQKEKYRYIPSLITLAEGVKIKQLECGSEHTLALLCRADDINLDTRERPRTMHSIKSSSLKRGISLLMNISAKPTSVRGASESADSLPTSSYEPSHVSIVSNSTPDLSCTETPAMDSGTVSSDSCGGAAQLDEPVSAVLSNSPGIELVLEGNIDQDSKPAVCRTVPTNVAMLKMTERDEPYTLSPIDSPRSIPIHQSVMQDPNPLSKVRLAPAQHITDNSARKGSGDSSTTDEFPAIYSWGWNEHGNCGLGTTCNVSFPEKIKSRGVVLLIGTGSGHSFALIRNHKVSL